MTDALLALIVVLQTVSLAAGRGRARRQLLATLARTPEEYQHLRDLNVTRF